MKLLYVPLLVPGGANEQLDLLAAFQKVLGSKNVASFDYYNYRGNPNHGLLQKAFQFHPDLLHLQLQETDKINAGTLQNIKRRFPSLTISQWNGDVRFYAMENMVKAGRFCDFTLLSNEGQIPLYEEKIGRKNCCFYWQNAVGPRFYTDLPPLKERRGIGFCGNNYGNRPAEFPQSVQRIELRKALKKTFKKEFRSYGGGWEKGIQSLPWIEQPQFYRTCRATISQNHTVTARYFSDRTLIMMATGVPHIFHYSPGVEVDFVDEEDCLYWTTVEEAMEKARWILDHPVEAEAMGQRGLAKIKAHHNWDVRVQEFQKILGINFTAPPIPSSRKAIVPRSYRSLKK